MGSQKTRTRTRRKPVPVTKGTGFCGYGYGYGLRYPRVTRGNPYLGLVVARDRLQPRRRAVVLISGLVMARDRCRNPENERLCSFSGLVVALWPETSCNPEDERSCSFQGW